MSTQSLPFHALHSRDARLLLWFLLLWSPHAFTQTADSTHTAADGAHAAVEDTHAHSEWVEPPAEYTGVKYDGWNDPDAEHIGAEIFQAQCAVCHGDDGRGTGPLAGSLAHPPADLTSHFHVAPGIGDAYLFWRVSEGGTVEPFLSLGSAMPAFKSVLSEKDRWDVLTYVHRQFHKSFTGDPDEDAHESTAHSH